MKLNVWYLDDEVELCKLFIDEFTSDKVSVTTFSNPKIAIEAAALHPPDLFFIDFRLPQLNGEEVAQSLAPEIPKVLVTADQRIKVSNIFLKVIMKPYQEEDILSVLNIFLNK